MNYRMLSGISTRGFAAAAIIMFWITAFQYFFGNAFFGVYPFVLAMLPFIIALLEGRPLLLGKLPKAILPYMAAALAILMPVIGWLLFISTSGIPFLDGTSTPTQFFYFFLFGLLFAGLPLDAVAATKFRAPASLQSTGWLLIGFGAGIALLSLIADAVSLPLLMALQAVAAAGTILPAWTDETKAAEVKSKGKSFRLPSPATVTFVAIPGLLMFTLPFFLEMIAETPVASDGSAFLLVAAVAAAAGIGFLLALRWRKSESRQSTAAHSPAIPNHAVLAGLTAALIFSYLFRDFWSARFADFYRAWYEGGTAGLSLTELLPGIALAVLTLTLASVPGENENPRRDLRFPLLASMAAGLLLALFLRSMLPVHLAALMLIVPSLLIAVYEFIRRFRKDIVSGITLAAIIGVGYFAFPIHQPEFRNYFDPVNFQITADEPTPSGRMTLLRSRDYDDRFFALFWNQAKALTQSSRAVQSDLYRMGHLPMLMHENGARVLMLGLGSSLPIEAVTMHAPKSVDCVEPMAATLHLADSTRLTLHPWRYLKDVRFHNERVPAFLARSKGPFDVIISAEPLAVPATDAGLFAEAYFQSAARLLSDDGIFMQWMPVARMDLASMRRVFVAILEVFPHVEMWMSSADPESGMVGILASKSGFASAVNSSARFTQLINDPARRFHLQQIQLDNYALAAACFAADAAGLRTLTADAVPYTLFDGPQIRSDRTTPDIATDVDRLLSARTSADRMLSGTSDSVRGLAVQILAARPAVLRARVAVLNGDDSSAVRLLSDPLRAAPQNGEVRRVFGDMMLRQAAGYVGSESYPTAVAMLNTAMQLLPLNTYMLRLFMIASFNIGDREASGLAIDGIKRLDPSHAGFRDNQATIRAKQGGTDDALLLYETAITLDAKNEEFYCNMASFHYSQQRIWEAIRVLDQATDAAYYPAKALYLKGLFYGEQGRVKFAKEAFEKYLDVATPLDPNRTDVEKRLEQLRSVKEK